MGRPPWSCSCRGRGKGPDPFAFLRKRADCVASLLSGLAFTTRDCDPNCIYWFEIATYWSCFIWFLVLCCFPSSFKNLAVPTFSQDKWWLGFCRNWTGCEGSGARSTACSSRSHHTSGLRHCFCVWLAVAAWRPGLHSLSRTYSYPGRSVYYPPARCSVAFANSPDASILSPLGVPSQDGASVNARIWFLNFILFSCWRYSCGQERLGFLTLSSLEKTSHTAQLFDVSLLCPLLFDQNV